jgi:hypothetical protein
MGAWEASALNHFSDPNPGFSGIMAFVPVSVDGVVHDTRSGSAQAEIISANYFAVLGVRPYVGNLIPTAQEIGSSVILSFSYWQREFGQEKAILGKTIRIDGASYTVLGVTPPEFFGMRVGNSTDFYVPLAPGHRLAGPNTRSLDWAMAIGRLKPGISPAQAAASAGISANPKRVRNTRSRATPGNGPSAHYIGGSGTVRSTASFLIASAHSGVRGGSGPVDCLF